MEQNKLALTIQHRILNMHFEYEDYRKKPPKPWMGIWPLWEVPSWLALDYVAKLGIFLVGVPYLFGLYFTALGLLTNFLLIDYFVYRSYKFKINQMWGDKDE